MNEFKVGQLVQFKDGEPFEGGFARIARTDDNPGIYFIDFADKKGLAVLGEWLIPRKDSRLFPKKLSNLKDLV